MSETLLLKDIPEEEDEETPLLLKDIPDSDDTPLLLKDIEVERELPVAEPAFNLLNHISGPGPMVEATATIVTGMAASVAGGISALGSMVTNLAGVTDVEPGDVVAQVQETFTYVPRTEIGEKVVSAISYPFEKIAEWSTDFGGVVGDVAAPVFQATADFKEPWFPFSTITPEQATAGLAAGVKTAVELAPYIFGPKIIKGGIEQIRKVPLKEALETAKSVVSPIGTGSAEAQAVAKTFANSMREIAAMRNHVLAQFDKKYKRADADRMGNAVIAEELSSARGVKAEGGIDTLSMSEKNDVAALLARHRVVAEKAMELGIIPPTKDFYFPRKVVGAIGNKKMAERVYGQRAVKTATQHAKKRKYETIEETEAAAIRALGKDVSISRDIRQIPIITAELETAIAGKTLISEVRRLGTESGTETVRLGLPDADYFRIEHPAFSEWKPRTEARPAGEVGPMGGKTKVVRTEDGEIVYDRHPLSIRKDFEGPLRAILDNESGLVYRGLMQLKAKSMSVIMFSPLLHGQVIWGKVLPFQPLRTLTFRNYVDGHRIQNIRGNTPKEIAKQAQNNAWVRDKSNGEFATGEEAMREALSVGLFPIENMGWMQRMTDLVGPPTLEAGRSWTARSTGKVFRPLGKDAELAARKAVDWAGHIWHDKLLWDQIRAMGYGLWFDLRQSGLKAGMSPEASGTLAAHLSNRFMGTIPFEDMSSGMRGFANVMLFSKSFTGTNLGLYTDAIRGLPRAVQSRLIEAGENLQGVKHANRQVRKAASAALAKDIAFVYLLNSMLQNVSQYWRESMDLEIAGLLDGPKGEKFINIDREALIETTRKITEQYSSNVERYREMVDNPLNAVTSLSELAAGSINDPGKENRVYVGSRPDGTAMYMRSPIGKVGEDLLKSMTDPIELAWNKISPTAGFVAGVSLNDKSKQRGFDLEVYDPDGSSLEALRDIFFYFIEAHVPLDYAEAVVEAALGTEDDVQRWRAMMEPLGMSFSSGAPGGPARATLFAAEDRYRRSIRRHSPEAKKLILNGKFEEAANLMINEADMRPDDVEYWLSRKVAPVMTENQIKDFLMIANELELAKMQDQLKFFNNP